MFLLQSKFLACTRDNTVSLAVDCTVVGAVGQQPKGICESQCSTDANKIAEYAFEPIQTPTDFPTAINTKNVAFAVAWLVFKVFD
jgi:hypothetical protein